MLWLAELFLHNGTLITDTWFQYVSFFTYLFTVAVGGFHRYTILNTKMYFTVQGWFYLIEFLFDKSGVKDFTCTLFTIYIVFRWVQVRSVSIAPSFVKFNKCLLLIIELLKLDQLFVWDIQCLAMWLYLLAFKRFSTLSR